MCARFMILDDNLNSARKLAHTIPIGLIDMPEREKPHYSRFHGNQDLAKI